MKKKTLWIILLLGVSVQLFTACERRPLEDDFAEMALIPVKIDWSKSGIAVTSPGGNGLVHRVSLRFFPKDGSRPFDRYLESNVIEGEIEVPVGSYDVVVYNEAIDDIYWEDVIYFTDANNYNSFAANITAANLNDYPRYKMLPDEELIVEPLRLASWSIENFTVTKDMVTYSRSRNRSSITLRDTHYDELTRVVMRPLTYTVTISASIENLCSAHQIQTGVRGFAKKVYMASAQTEQLPATHIVTLNGRIWDDVAQRNGRTSSSFLSFGRLPQSSQYWVNLDVLLITGASYTPPQPLLFNVTDQVGQTSGNLHYEVEINIDLNLSLPYHDGGIRVDEWGEDEYILQ